VSPYRISRAQVAYDIDELKRRWIEAGVESFSLTKARALMKLDAIEYEAWESWEQSKADGPGNPTFAKVVLEVHDRREMARERLHHAVDTLNQTFGIGSVYFGGVHGVTENAPMRISFTRIPTPELEEIDPARGRRVRPIKAVPLPEDDEQ
jgi:hypothetical protein